MRICIHGRDSGKLSNSTKWLEPSLKYYLQLKTKDGVGGRGMGLGKGERQFAQRWKRKCLVNKCLLGHAETMEHRVDTI